MAGNIVSFNGHAWKAKWWTQGEVPGTTGPWGVWEDLEIALPQYRPSIPGGSASRPSCRSSAPGDRMYVAYASSWNTSIYDLTTVSIPNYITHLNLAFVRPDTTYIQGSYAFDQAVAGLEFVEGATTPNGQRKFTAQQSQDLRNNIAGLRARGTKAFLSVGGWSYSQGSQWSRFNAKNIVDLALDLCRRSRH